MQALAAAKEGNDKYSEAVAAANLGLVFRLTGNTRLAVEHLATALSIAEGLGYSNLLSVALGRSAWVKVPSLAAVHAATRPAPEARPEVRGAALRT